MNKQNSRKGIILAGGTGSRLFPMTQVVSKQLLPIYDKPMIYYPLSTLMLSGIRDILIITRPSDQNLFKNLLKDGSQWGLNLNYLIQNEPKGISEAFLIAEKFIDKKPVTLILGDNLFYGDNFSNQLQKYIDQKIGATIFSYLVNKPERYGVVEFDKNKKVINIVEKPKESKTSYAITGIYFYDGTVVEKTKKLIPSSRGELEITDLNLIYLKENNLNVEVLGKGTAWLDTGTFNSLHQASEYIKILEQRQGIKIGCPEEIAWTMKWIDDEKLINLTKPLLKSGYGEYLLRLIKKNKFTSNL